MAEVTLKDLHELMLRMNADIAKIRLDIEYIKNDVELIKKCVPYENADFQPH